MLSALLILSVLGPGVTLSGVVLAQSGRHAATLVSEGRVRSVVSGDRAFGCDVVSIQETGVSLACADGPRTLALEAADSPAGARIETSPVATAMAPADVTMSRVDLEARLDREMSRLMTETTIVPVTSGGQIAGFTLSRVPEGTILETLGLKAGDVLVSVNDTPVDSFATLVGLWPKLQTSGSVMARIMRGGRPMDISVSIR